MTRPRCGSRCTSATTTSRRPAAPRADFLAQLAATGLDRIVAFPGRYGATEEVTEAFAADCLAAGLSLGGAVAAV